LVAYDFSSWTDRVKGVVVRSWKGMLQLLLLGSFLPALGVILVVGGIGVGLVVLLASTLDHPTPLPFVAVVVPMYLLILLGIGYFSTVTQLSLMKVATNDAAGQPVSLGEAYTSSFRFGWPTLGWLVLAGLVTALGSLACYLPGLYLYVALSLVVPIMAFERQGGFTESFRLMHSNFWPAVGRIGLLFLVVYALSSAVNGGMYFLFAIVSAVIRAGGDDGSVIGVVLVLAMFLLFLIVAVAVSYVSQLVMQAGYLVTYAELRGRLQPGLTTAQLAAEVNA
jgi:hypothetical protein